MDPKTATDWNPAQPHSEVRVSLLVPPHQQRAACPAGKRSLLGGKVEALVGEWRKKARWQPPWQEWGLGLCRGGGTSETFPSVLPGTYSGNHKHQVALRALSHASHSCPGATFSAVLVQHLWWPPGKALATSCDSSGLASPGPVMLGLASCLGAPAGLTSQAPHLWVPFWHCPQALAWRCHGVVVPLPSLVPVHAPPQGWGAGVSQEL